MPHLISALFPGNPLFPQIEMTASSSVNFQEFIEREIPEWQNDEFVAAKFRAFGDRQDEGWGPKVHFWTAMVVQGARHLGTLTVTADEVKHRWFLNNGVTPLGMDTVLVEMLRHKHLQRLEIFLPQEQSLLWWSVKSVGKSLSWMGERMFGGSSADPEAISGTFVVMQVLKEKTDVIRKIVLDSAAFSSDLIITKAKLAKLSGGDQEATLITRYLTLEKRALQICLNEGDVVEGVKFLRGGKESNHITENDRHILRLRHTSELLEGRSNNLRQKVLKAKQQAIEAVKRHDKQAGLRHLRRMRGLATTVENCFTFLDKIEAVLHLITQAENSKQVTEALRIGAKAVLEHGVSVDDARACMAELEEAISLHQEREATLAAGSSMAEEEQVEELEQEFAQLEAELEPRASVGKSIQTAAPSKQAEAMGGSFLDNRVSLGTLVSHTPSSRLQAGSNASEGGAGVDRQNVGVLESQEIIAGLPKEAAKGGRPEEESQVGSDAELAKLEAAFASSLDLEKTALPIVS